MSIERIPIAEIDVEGAPVVRDAVNKNTVKEYSELITKVGVLPPLDVFKIPKSQFVMLADGLHRLEAAKLCKMTHIACNVMEGSTEDCYKFALKANQKHGLRRTDADKRACIQTAITRWKDASNAAVAKLCGVSDHTVAAERKSMEKEQKAEPRGSVVDVRGRPQPARKPRRPRTTFANANEEVVVAQRSTPEKGVVRNLDAIGYPITPDGIPHWERRQEIQDWMTRFSDMKSELKRICDSKDILFYGFNFPDADSCLSKLYSNMKNAKPYTVCTTCEGRLSIKPGNKCPFCGGKALISEFQWDVMSPKQIKEIRLKSIKAKA